MFQIYVKINFSNYVCPIYVNYVTPALRQALNLAGDDQLVWEAKDSEFSFFDFEQLLEATNNFSEEYKLVQGGFGAVYKVISMSMWYFHLSLGTI